MRIGIITLWNSEDNYGQQLQCFALQRYLRNQGHDAFLIRYRPEERTRTLLDRVKGLTFRKIWNKLTGANKSDGGERLLHEQNRIINVKRQFESFRRDNLSMTERIYNSIDELRDNPPIADMYITGSDQVWPNPYNVPDIGGMFLDFGDEKTKRISYGASIGRNIKDEEKSPMKHLLNNFNAISVREPSAKDILEKFGFKDAQIVLDPTLILPVSDFLSLSDNTELNDNAPFLFVYHINIRTKEELYWDKIEKYIRDKGLTVKSVSSSGYLAARQLVPIGNNIPATVPEWLSLIQKSECVITTSFHGVVFAIKMHKPFLAILLTNENSKANDRIVTLLKICGLEQRILNPNIDVTSCSVPMQRVG